MMKSQTPSASLTIHTEIVLPNDTNVLGNLMGGRLLQWRCAEIAAVISNQCNNRPPMRFPNTFVSSGKTISVCIARLSEEGQREARAQETLRGSVGRDRQAGEAEPRTAQGVHRARGRPRLEAAGPREIAGTRG